MIIKKIKKIIAVPDILVYQPGRVGSTALVQYFQSNGRSVIHLHSFTRDRIFFLKYSDVLMTISYFVVRVIGLLYRARLHILRRNISILVPIRDQGRRDNSAFWEFFEVACFRSLSKQWYRKFYKSEASQYLRALEDEFKCENGIQRWFDYELSAFTGIKFSAVDLYLKNPQTVLHSGRLEIIIVNMEHPKSIEKYQLSSTETNTGKNKWINQLIK